MSQGHGFMLHQMSPLEAVTHQNNIFTTVLLDNRYVGYSKGKKSLL